MPTYQVTESGQFVDLIEMDVSQPVFLIASLESPLSCYQFGPASEYTPSLTLLDASGNILKKWAGTSNALNINEDIRSLLQGKFSVQIQFVAMNCALSATTYYSTISIELVYTSLILPTSDNPVKIPIEGISGGTNPDGTTFGPLGPTDAFGKYVSILKTMVDLTLWDGKTPVIINFSGSVPDGGIVLLVNGKQAFVATSAQDPSFSGIVDITPYSSQGPTTIDFQYESAHFNNQAFSVENIEVSFYSPFKIPNLVANATVNNNEAIDVNGATSILSGALSFYTDLPAQVMVDTKGYSNPSQVQVPDSSQETKISISKTVSSDIESFDVDFYIILGGKQYFWTTKSFQVATTKTDTRPVLTSLGFQLFAQVEGLDFVATCRGNFKVDNSNSDQPVSVTVALNYFGTRNQTFSIPARTSMVAWIDQSFVASIDAIKSTGGHMDIYTVGNNPVDIIPDFVASDVLVIGSAPPIPSPVFTPPVSGGTNPQPSPQPPSILPPATRPPVQAIVLSKNEKIVIVGGVAGGVAILVSAVLSRKKTS